MQKFWRILAVIGLSWLLAACGTETPTAVIGGTPLPTPAPTVAANLPPVENLLKEASAGFSSLQTLHLSLDIRQGKTEVNGIEVKQVESDLEQPDKYQAQVKVHVLVADFTLPVIGPGGGIQYMRDETGKWSLSQPQQIVNLGGLLDKQGGLAPSLLKLQGARLLGQEKLQTGQTAYHVQGTLAAQDVATLTFSKLGRRDVAFDVWLGEDNTGAYQVWQLQLKEVGTGTDLALWFLRFSNFNEPISIQKP